MHWSPLSVNSNFWHIVCSKQQVYQDLGNFSMKISSKAGFRMRPAKKSTPCFIKKASRCAADRTSKTTCFIFHFLYNTQRFYEKIFWLVQWWKLYYSHIFFTQRTTDFDRLKRNMTEESFFWLQLDSNPQPLSS